MCGSCMSSSQGASQDLNAKPFGGTNDGSMGDAGVAIRSNTKFDGANSTDQKFEGEAPDMNVGAAQAQYSGRQ